MDPGIITSPTAAITISVLTGCAVFCEGDGGVCDLCTHAGEMNTKREKKSRTVREDVIMDLTGVYPGAP